MIMGGAKIAGGIAIGFLGMPVICRYLAPMIDKTYKYRNFYGLVHVVAGALAATFVKKQVVRDMALTVAGVGIYDLIARNLPMLQLPSLPSYNPMIGGSAELQALKGEDGVVGMEADYAPALGSSYQQMGASYGEDDISYGGDDGIEL